MNTDFGQIKSIKEIDPRATRRESALTQNSWSRLVEFQVWDGLYFSANNAKAGLEPRLAEGT